MNYCINHTVSISSDPSYSHSWNYRDRWLHGDMKDMAYFYVYPLFYKLQGKEFPNEANSD